MQTTAQSHRLIGEEGEREEGIRKGGGGGGGGGIGGWVGEGVRVKVEVRV